MAASRNSSRATQAQPVEFENALEPANAQNILYPEAATRLIEELNDRLGYRQREISG
jgi:hypothetical protein